MADRKPVNPAGASPNPALSLGMIVGDLLFVSGTVALDSGGNVIGEVTQKPNPARLWIISGR